MNQPPSPPRPLPLPAVPWYRKPPLLILVSGAATLALVFSCFTALAIYGASLPPAPTPGPTAFAFVTSTAVAKRSTVQPTATVRAIPSVTSVPTMTPTPAAQVVSGASVGGTQAAFTTAFGQPSISYGIPHFTYTSPGGITVDVALDDLHIGTDGQQRADLIGFSSSDPTWANDASTRLAIVAHFFPANAVHVRDDSDPQVGPLHVYQSADLGVSLSASEFTNANTGAQLPLGTFTVACEQPQNVACTMATGE